MKLEFISRSENNDRLILIFAGWGSDPRMYANAVRQGWDTLVAYDFDDFSFPTDILNSYSTIYLFAWSLGVFAAQRSIPANKVTGAFAINGTTNPVSPEYGIPENVFFSTLNTLDHKNLIKFRLRMAGSKTMFNDMNTILPESPDIDRLKLQLNVVATECGSPSDRPSLPWRRVYIGGSDRIFPPDAQANAWEQHEMKPEIIHLEAPHFINVAQIVRSVIPDLGKVGRRFHEAAPTYDHEASAQKSIATRLCSLIESRFSKREGLRILEIGPGTGVFTYLYGRALHPEMVTFVELYPTTHYGIAPKEHYVVGDAERWMDSCEEQFDMILSASAIQWFADHSRFFANSARLLAPGGLLACSTFLPGNLHQLDGIRPSPMLYVPEERLKSMADMYFHEVEVYSEEINLSFNSPREAILHLKHTGVGGSAPALSSAAHLLQSLSPSNPDSSVTLTYLPAYIIASK